MNFLGNSCYDKSTRFRFALMMLVQAENGRIAVQEWPPSPSLRSFAASDPPTLPPFSITLKTGGRIHSHFNALKSLGAAHCVAQCVRWKTRSRGATAISIRIYMYSTAEREHQERLTFFNTILFWPFVLGVLCLCCYALGAFVVVVLGWGALGGFGAFC